MFSKLFLCCFVIAVITVQQTVSANSGESSIKASNKKTPEPESTSSSSSASASTSSTSDTVNTVAANESPNEVNKDKRQISSKITQIYPNHRTETIVDDPEVAQETIYGTKPNQFIIRAVSPHQHQQHEEHQEPPQLRNYPTSASRTTANQRPHTSSQQLDQSQELQHYAYLQELSRNHPKNGAATSHGKSRGPLAKKANSARAQLQYSKPEEAEQRYAVTIEAPVHDPRQFHLLRQYQQQAQQQHLQHYQIIPEEHFLKLIEEELQARAYHDEHLRQQQHADRNEKGLGDFRQRLASPTPTAPSGSAEPQAALAPTPAYVQYVPRHRGGPKYLPLQNAQHKLPASQMPESSPEPQPELPPQIAYYQPQISYKALPNHPLAKSSLEKEIEKLLATNQQSAAEVQIYDNSNEPSAIVNHHHYEQPQSGSQSQSQPQPQPQPQLHANRSPKAYIANTTPNTLLDANNQPFIPSLFRFSNFQTPTPIYPTQVPQEVIDAKKLGPVVYPTQSTTPAQPAQPSQYYYQEALPSTSTSPSPSPSPKPKAYRPKQYDLKLLQTSPFKSSREKTIKISSPTKYAQPLIYDFNNPSAPHTSTATRSAAQSAPNQFYPSPPDPNHSEITHNQRAQPTQATTRPEAPPNDFRQYLLPSPAPSQSTIFVSQGTGVTTPSRPHKPKTLEDVKQLRLPQPGGKPLTQAEFQSLVDAGYPITAVPVPVPVPYEQYIKDHPEYRNQPLDYAQIMRNAQQHYAAHSASRLAVASEPSVKIVSSPERTSATAHGDGSVTYLRPIHSSSSSSSSSSGSKQQQRRHPRDNEKETKVAGDKEKTANKQ